MEQLKPVDGAKPGPAGLDAPAAELETEAASSNVNEVAPVANSATGTESAGPGQSVAASPFPRAQLPSLPLLVRLRRQLDQERQSWYLLLICCGFFGFGSFGLLLGILASVLSFPVAMGAIALLVIFGEQNYRKHLKQVLAEMLHGPMLLVVLDESIGRAIEEQRRERYRPVMRQVELGEGLLARLNHAAHYYKHYRRAAYGQMEQLVPAMSQISCFSEGLLLLLASCTSWLLIGVPLLILQVIRLMDLWPRTLAVKQAVLEILEGRHEAELEEAGKLQLLRRGMSQQNLSSGPAQD
ncbi:hypothetical protein IT575_04680 [bacterium]|nr:hypothetical protein [bacterium]